MKAGDLQAILLAIHRTALDSREWQTVLDLLARLSGGAHMHLFGHDAATGEGIKLDGALYDPDFMRSYDEYYNRLNVWAPGYLKAQVGVPMSTRELLPQEQFERTEFYNDWIRPQEDILGGAGVMLARDGDRIVALGGNIRRKDVDRLEGEFVALLEMLAPHMRLALEVAQRVGELHVEREAILSGVAAGASVFLLSDDSTLVHANPAGHAALESGFLVRYGPRSTLRLTHPKANEALQSALRKPAFARGGAMDISASGAEIDLRLIPVDPASLPRVPFPLLYHSRTLAAVLVLSPRTQTPDPVSRVLQSFGLTDAETAVARELAQGLSLPEIAAKRGVSLNTIRNQTQSILTKSGAKRQAELVVLVHRLAAEIERNADPR